MTIKKRLAVSNLIMILVPVCITLLVGLLCLGAVYWSLHTTTGFGFENSNQFYATSQAASAAMHEVFEHGSADAKDRLQTIGNIIDPATTYVEVQMEGSDFYRTGDQTMADPALMTAARQIGSGAFVSGERHQMYYYTDRVDGQEYELFLFSNNNHQDSNRVKWVFIGSALLLVAAIVASITLTNRFLTRFALRKIEEPLDLLSDGVQQISKGNLEYRLDYNREDEFLPVCLAFNDMARRLQQSVEMTKKNEENRKELLLDISHDLRSPLTSIRAYVEGLLDGVAQTPEMQRRYLHTIARKTADIEKMVSALFAYSKLDMGELAVHCTPVPLAAFLDDAVGDLQEEYRRKGLTVTAAAPADLTVRADGALLQRVVTNLMDNSLKYKDKPVATLEISARRTENGAELRFADNGPGVEPDQLEKLFDVFYRTDKARSNTGSGSGIGLAFVKKAITAMNGSVWAQQNESGGLTVCVQLECDDGKDTDH